LRWFLQRGGERKKKKGAAGNLQPAKALFPSGKGKKKKKKKSRFDSSERARTGPAYYFPACLAMKGGRRKKKARSPLKNMGKRGSKGAFSGVYSWGRRSLLVARANEGNLEHAESPTRSTNISGKWGGNRGRGRGEGSTPWKTDDRDARPPNGRPNSSEGKRGGGKNLVKTQVQN